MATICFMVLGTYILYYKALLKVDTVIKIKSMSFITMLMLGVICLCHAILVILTAVMVDFKSSSQDDMNSKTNTFIMVTSVFELIIVSIEFFLFFMTHKLSKNALETMFKFHDYLVNYRLTPRSRILRKHLPRMTMVIEEESDYDGKSSMAASQVGHSVL